MRTYKFVRHSPAFWLKLISSAFLSVALLLMSPPTQAGSVQYFYDPSGRLNGMEDSVNGTALYNYDAVGNILSVSRQPITSLVVAQISPTRGGTGSLVTISGSGFGNSSNTTVSFHGTAAVITSITSTQIVASVPSAASSGNVTVTTSAGTYTSQAVFNVTNATTPTINSFSPARGDQNTTLTVSGTGFDPVLANDKLSINGQLATVTAASTTSLTATIPVATSGPLRVVLPQGSATSSASLIVPPAGYPTASIGSVVNGQIGQSATTTINTAGQVGLLLFNATAGQRVSFQVTASSFSSSTMGLYGPDGSMVFYPVGFSNGTITGAPYLTRTGTYTLLIAPGSTATGAATINLLNVPADVTGTIGTNGSPVTLTTTAANQSMSLSFQGTIGQRIALYDQLNSGSTNVSNRAAIFEPDGLTQLFSQYLISTGFQNYSGTIILPVSGLYSIRTDLGGTGPDSITFTVPTVPPDMTGNLTVDGATTTLTTIAPDQNMVLTFSGTVGQRIALYDQIGAGTVDQSNRAVVIEPDGVTALYSQYLGASDYSDVIVLPVTGTYKIVVGIVAQGYGSVSFALHSVPADASGTITIGGAAVTLTTTAPDQNMILTFSGTAGQRVALYDQVGSGTVDSSSRATLIAPDGTTQIYSQWLGTSNYSDVIVLPTSGTYTIKTDIAAMGFGSVSFNLYTVPPDVTGTIVANGQPVSLTTTAPDQNMILTFSGTANQKTSFFDQVGAGSLDSGSRVAVVEPDGVTQLFSQYIGCCSSSVYSDVLVLPATGTYQLFTNINGTGSGTIKFTLYNEPADAAATITPGGGSIGLTTTVPGQNATLSFNGTSGKRVGLLTQFDSALTAACYNSVQILEPDGATQLYNSSPYCNTSSDFSGALPKPASITTTIPTLPTSGQYKISLNPTGSTTGTATFTLYDVPADTTSTTTVGHASSNYATSIPGQAIRVAFAGTASQSVTVQVGVVNSVPASPCYTITTLDPDGMTVLRGDQSCSANYSSGSLSLPQTGNYTVVVSPSGTTTGTFGVAVTTP